MRSKSALHLLLPCVWLSALFLLACGPQPSVATVGTLTPVVAFGDSLTQGNQDASNVTYPSVLSTLIGSPVANYGIAGQLSGQICARMGACAGTVTVNGGQIPTSGIVGIQFPNQGYEPAFLAPAGMVEISIAGVVGYTWDIGAYPNYAFQPLTPPAAPVAVSGVVPYKAVLPAGSLTGTVLIWAGRNNWFQPQQVEADISTMVSYVVSQGGTPLVLTVLDGAVDGYQSVAYDVILATNAWILNTYPKSSLDVRSLLVSAYDPNLAADVLDHTADTPPFSLRAIDVRGTISSAMTTATCSSAPIPVTAGMSPNFVMQIGTELIRVDDDSAGYVTACDRGYAGTVPASYPSGQAYSGVDSLHLNGVANGNTTCFSRLGIGPIFGVNCAGYPLVAYFVYEKLRQMQGS